MYRKEERRNQKKISLTYFDRVEVTGLGKVGTVAKSAERRENDLVLVIAFAITVLKGMNYAKSFRIVHLLTLPLPDCLLDRMDGGEESE